MTTLTTLPVTVKKISDPTSQVAVSNGLSITKTTSGVQTVLPAVDHARMLVGIFAECTEDYADNTGTASLFSIGDSDDATRWGASGDAGVPYFLVDVNTNKADIVGVQPSGAGDRLKTQGCILAANKALIVTCTPAVGDGTGGCKLVVITVNAP